MQVRGAGTLAALSGRWAVWTVADTACAYRLVKADAQTAEQTLPMQACRRYKTADPMISPRVWDDSSETWNRDTGVQLQRHAGVLVVLGLGKAPDPGNLPGSMPFHRDAGPSSRAIVATVPSIPLQFNRDMSPSSQVPKQAPALPIILTCTCCPRPAAAGAPWPCPAAG